MPTQHIPLAQIGSRISKGRRSQLKCRGYARRMWPYGCRLVFLACLTFGEGSSLFAQAPRIVERLSPDTVFYLEWRGTASLVGTEQKNHLLQLLHDPATMPMWTALTSQIERSGPKGPAPITRLLMPDLVSLLDNPAVFGVVAIPEAQRAPATGKAASPFATFLVYDLTGKADLIEKWRTLSTMTTQMPTEVTKYDFGGTSVEVRTTATGASYIAQTRNYFLTSDQKKVIEDLITRFRETNSGSASVTGLAAYGQMRKYVGNDATLEFFGRMPDVGSWKDSPSTKSIHLEKVHAIGGGVSFDGERTRMRGAILGDTSPGGPFDLAGASLATFQTQPAVETAPAFSISRINLASVYQLVIGAVAGNLPGQAAQLEASQRAAEAFLGMPVVDALGLFTGEIASMTTYADDGAVEQLFAVSVRKPDAVLRVVRALASTMIVSEDSSGATTFLDLAYPYRDPQTHVERRRFYYLAVTPQMLLAAPRKALLRGAIERLNPQAADPPPTGVVANPDYRPLRSRLPERLSGLGAADIGLIPWEKIVANLKSQAASSNRASQQPPDWSWLQPAVISRYLHFALSGWWKDSNGVYFDSYIQ